MQAQYRWHRDLCQQVLAPPDLWRPCQPAVRLAHRSWYQIRNQSQFQSRYQSRYQSRFLRQNLSGPWSPAGWLSGHRFCPISCWPRCCWPRCCWPRCCCPRCCWPRYHYLPQFQYHRQSVTQPRRSTICPYWNSGRWLRQHHPRWSNYQLKTRWYHCCRSWKSNPPDPV